MKLSKQIAFCGIMAALASALMLVSYFPYLTYSVPCIAGLISMIVIIELSEKWAWACYAVSGIITLFFAEPEAKLLYIFFFGYYPALKVAIERIPWRAVSTLLKFFSFNVSVVLAYLLFAGLFGVDLSSLNEFGKYSILIFLGLGNILFLVYDKLIERLASQYMIRLHRSVASLMKKGK